MENEEQKIEQLENALNNKLKTDFDDAELEVDGECYTIKYPEIECCEEDFEGEIEGGGYFVVAKFELRRNEKK